MLLSRFSKDDLLVCDAFYFLHTIAMFDKYQ